MFLARLREAAERRPLRGQPLRARNRRLDQVRPVGPHQLLPQGERPLRHTRDPGQQGRAPGQPENPMSPLLLSHFNPKKWDHYPMESNGQGRVIVRYKAFIKIIFV